MTELETYLLYTRACDAGMDMTLAAQCVAEINDRIGSGRSHDCDEYRELLRVTAAATGETK